MKVVLCTVSIEKLKKKSSMSEKETKEWKYYICAYLTSYFVDIFNLLQNNIYLHVF